jgi:hypothetical protein
VLKPSGNLRLDQEPLPAGGIVRVVVEDLLERYLAVQLAVECDEDRPQTALGVGPKDAESLALHRLRGMDQSAGRFTSSPAPPELKAESAVSVP